MKRIWQKNGHGDRRNDADERNSGLFGGRRRDGPSDAGARLVGHPARPGGRLAAEPQGRPRHPARLPLPHVRLVGTPDGHVPQRRLRPHPRQAPPRRPRQVRPRRLVGDLGRHPAPDGAGAARGAGVLGRGAAARHGAERLHGRGVLHLLLQSDPGRPRRRGRHLLRLLGGHGAGVGPAPHAHPAGVGPEDRRGQDRRGRLQGRLGRAGREPLRPPLHPPLPARRRRQPRTLGRCDGPAGRLARPLAHRNLGLRR